MNYNKLKVGYLINTYSDDEYDSFIGRITKKTAHGCILENGHKTRVMYKDAKFDVLDTEMQFIIEMDLQKFAKDEAEKRGFIFIHLPKGKDGTSRHQKAGVPDCIVVVPNGITLFIELKTKSSLRVEQIAFLEKLDELQHLWYVAKTPEDIINIYEEYV